MYKEITFNIDKHILNIFTSKNIDEILKLYNIDKHYYLNQIHSNKIHIVDDKYINGSDGDALITNKINTPLIIKTADCIPIVIYDKENKVIAAIHSGWKGTLNNIVINTIKIMKEKFNCQKENIYVYLYPSIRRCHFEVKQDVYLEFKNKIVNIDNYVLKKERSYYIDLQQIVKDNIKLLGINNIIDSNICTYCYHDKFYSYRYNKTNKRNILFVMIKE